MFRTTWGRVNEQNYLMKYDRNTDVVFQQNSLWRCYISSCASIERLEAPRSLVEIKPLEISEPWQRLHYVGLLLSSVQRSCLTHSSRWALISGLASGGRRKHLLISHPPAGSCHPGAGRRGYSRSSEREPDFRAHVCPVDSVHLPGTKRTSQYSYIKANWILKQTLVHAEKISCRSEEVNAAQLFAWWLAEFEFQNWIYWTL